MTGSRSRKFRRRLFAPEVVQTSAMDCGPATLKCLLEGFGISVSYGRLREACQTDVDGTSIDTMEDVAIRLGLEAEQVMVPVEHVLMREAGILPAIVVVRLAGGITHFVVAWRRFGPFVQLMDPGTGRRWLSHSQFLDSIYIHDAPVPADAWVVDATSRVVQLYLRALDRPEAVPLQGTESVQNPLFSPDGQWVAFWSGDELKKVPVGGGPPVSICKIPDAPPFGASWTSGETIVFALVQGGLWQVTASGGEPKQLTTPDTSRGEYSHRLPHLFPGAEAVLFTVTKSAFPNWNETDVVVQSLRSGQRKVLIHGGADARYLPSGHLVYARQGVLMAVPFDVGRLAVTGGAVGVIENVMQAANTGGSAFESGAAQFSISGNGTLAYLPGGIAPDASRSLVWVDRRGIVQQLPFPPRVYGGPRISPDGLRMVLHTRGEGTTRVSLLDLVRGTSTWLTSEYSYGPIWTPDGTRVAYGAGEPPNLSWQLADGSAASERLATSDHIQFSASFAPDGKTLVFLQSQSDEPSRFDIHVLSLEGDRRPRPLIQTSSNEGWPELSPDGRWLAYGSNESGRYEVYVRPFPGPGAKQQISTNGGTSPAWARNGRELFYLGPSDESGTMAMMAVEVSAGAAFKAGMPSALFKGRFLFTRPMRNYDVTADGQRFIIVQVVDTPPPQPVTEINLIFNWAEELRRKVPSTKR